MMPKKSQKPQSKVEYHQSSNYNSADEDKPQNVKFETNLKIYVETTGLDFSRCNKFKF